MPPKTPHDPPPSKLTEGEIATLGRIARDREREEWLAERNKGRWERAKSWALWVAAAGAAKGVLWPPLSEVLEWLKSQFK